MSHEDIRWVQRLANYERARLRLTSAVELAATRELSDLEKQGLIQVFEFVFELAWNVMKDYFLYQGNPAITGSRDAIRTAFKNGLIADGEGWMEMIKSRNQSAHTYNEAVANEITEKILQSYHQLFAQFATDMQARAEQL
ncbi:MAG TPA: nucleotidyltransferase [Pseudomonas sp.]|nr:nucleotidyltransferase [Pseudomonas sp.]